MFLRYGKPLAPRVVVWSFFGGNDLSDYRRYERMKAEWATVSASVHGFTQRSFAKNVLRSIRRLWAEPEKAAEAPYGRCLAGREAPLAGLSFYYRSRALTAEDARTLDQAFVEIERVARVVEDRRAHLIVVYIPTKFEVYDGLCRFSPTSPVNDWVASDLRVRLAQRVEARLPGASFVDLTDRLRRAARERGVVYLSDDTHWTPLGHRVVAETLWDAARPVLAQPGTRPAPGSVRAAAKMSSPGS